MISAVIKLEVPPLPTHTGPETSVAVVDVFDRCGVVPAA